MRLLKEHLLSASIARTLVETAIVTLLLLVGGMLTWSSTNLPLVYLALPISAAIAAFRLRRSDRSFWQQVRREIVVAALLTLLISGIWLVSGFLSITLFSVPEETFFTSSAWGAVLLAILPVVTYVGMRMGIRVWIFWNRLRQRRFAWALTHALLFTVALVPLLLIALIALQLRPDMLPLFGAILLVTTGTMLVLLPPFALFSYIFARHTTRRIDTLAAATSALRQGNYATRVVVSGEDEIARLQADFNAMANDLEQTLHELHAERDRVARLMQAQRQLVASVSHELRTPVATIRSYLDASLEPLETAVDATTPALSSNVTSTTLPAILQADLRVIQRETARLQTLIDDLFTLARAETNSLSFRCVPTDIGQLTRQIVDTVGPVAWQRSRIEVVADIPEKLPYGLIDRTRWEQILHNLLHNAIRHTPPGGIIALIGRGDPSQLTFEVRDTGSGIAAEDLPHIFERFYRGADTTSTDGTGLGLALVKELLEAMNGSVQVTSTVGVGSCFTLHVPYATTELQN